MIEATARRTGRDKRIVIATGSIDALRQQGCHVGHFTVTARMKFADQR